MKEHIKLNPGKNFLNIRVIPNSSKTEFVGITPNNVIKINARGVPQKGKVNTEIINYLAKELGIESDKIKIVSGGTARNKLVRIVG